MTDEEKVKEQENGEDTTPDPSPEELEEVKTDEAAVSKEWDGIDGVEPAQDETDTGDPDEDPDSDEALSAEDEAAAETKSKKDAGEEEAADDKTGEDEEPDPDEADDEEPVEDDPNAEWTETVIPFKAYGKDKTKTFKVGKDGKLSPQSQAELTNTLALADGMQYKIQEVQKEFSEFKEQSQSEIETERRTHGEYVRSRGRQDAADEPIKHLLNAIRKEPYMREILERQKDEAIKTILKKHGWDGEAKSANYDPQTAIDKQEIAHQKYQIFKEKVDTLSDEKVNAYAEESGLSKDDVDKIIVWGRKNMPGSFAFHLDGEGNYSPPDIQAGHFLDVIKSAHGRMVLDKQMKTPDQVSAEKKLINEEELRQRRIKRQKKKNRSSKAAVSAPGQSAAGVGDADRPLEGESFVSFAARDAEVKKAWKNI